MQAAVSALKRCITPEALCGVSTSEMLVEWPGGDKQSWNYAHILPGAQRMYEAQLHRAAHRSAQARPLVQPVANSAAVAGTC